MFHSDLKSFLNDIPQTPIKYSKIGRKYDQFFSRFSIKKLKEINQRKVIGNLYDSIAKKNAKEHQTELIQNDRFIKVRADKHEGYLPTIRMICPETVQREEIDETKVETLNKNNKTINKDLYKDSDEEDDSIERIQRYEYIKRMNQRKLTRINKLKKIKNFVPHLRHYSLNYSLVEKKAPFVILKGRTARKKVTSIRKTLNLFQLKQEAGNNSYRKKNSESHLNRKNSSNSLQDKLMLKKPAYITSIIESSSIRSQEHSKPSTLLTHKNYVKERTSSTCIKKKKRFFESRDKSNKNNLSKVVSFKNMKGREKIVKHETNVNVPTLGTYSPKYTCIDKEKKGIAFNGEFSYAVYKKNIINKAIHDYNKSKEYIVIKLLHDSVLFDESILLTSKHKKLKAKEFLF